MNWTEEQEIMEIEKGKIMDAINSLAEMHWEWVEAQGWHNKSSALEYLALIASEVGEAINAARGENVEEIPTNLSMELADIILRTVDMAEQFGINLGSCVLEKMDINKKRKDLKCNGLKDR